MKVTTVLAGTSELDNAGCLMYRIRQSTSANWQKRESTLKIRCSIKFWSSYRHVRTCTTNHSDYVIHPSGQQRTSKCRSCRNGMANEITWFNKLAWKTELDNNQLQFLILMLRIITLVTSTWKFKCKIVKWTCNLLLISCKQSLCVIHKQNKD